VTPGCIFCSIAASDVAAHTVLRTDTVVAFLDQRPVFKGHTLVIPVEHHITLPDLPERLVPPLVSAVQRVAAAMEDALAADGTFVAVNNKVSQSVAHLHFHIVPRTKGDGLRGFFWPRVKYDDDAEMAGYAARLNAALR
jgi:histidine triad (HIT) family protein